MLILISHRGESRAPKTTKIEIFVSTTDSKLLTVFTKNFVLDAIGVLDLHEKRKTSSSHCSHHRLYILFVSDVQSNTVTLKQGFHGVIGYFDKRSMYDIQKKDPAGKKVDFFSPRYI